MDETERLRRREEARRRVVRQRRIAAGALAVALILVGVVVAGALPGGGGGGGPDDGDDAAAQPPPPPELPRGGRRIFPDHKVVGFYGAPQAAALGILGIGRPAEAARKLERQMRPYARRVRKKVLPAFELIAVIAAGAPGEDGKYRTRQPDRIVRRYFQAARRAKALYVLDIQPGQADFMTETRRFAKYLREPEVSLAIDPEWAMDPGEVPGQSIGSVDATTVNEISAYLSRIVRRHNLPQKMLIVHQFTDDMIERRQLLRKYPGVALTLNVDGFGGPQIKAQKYRDFTRPPRRFNFGFKLFYEEDTDLMSPRQVLALRPQPDLIMYE